MGSKQLHYLYLLAGISIITILVLLPILGSGFIYDDSIDSLIYGKIIDSQSNIFTYTFVEIMSWAHAGRFFPFAIISDYLLSFYTGSNLFLYKLVKLFFIGLDIVAFGYLVRLLTKSKLIGLFSVLIFLSIIQIRAYYDAFISFAILLQLVTLLVFTSLIYLILFIEKHKQAYFIFSLLLYMAALLTYEITYPFFILHFAIVCFYYWKNVKQILKLCIPYLLGAIAVAIVPFLLRLYYMLPVVNTNSTDAYVPNTDILQYIFTIVKQLIASVPLSYLIINPGKIFDTSHLYDEILSNYEMTVLIFILFLLLFLAISMCIVKRIDSRKITVNNINIVIFGFLLWVLPEVFIAFSPRYQAWITIGLSYLPVYISLFGISLIITGIVLILYRNVKLKNKSVLLSAILFLGLLFSLVTVIQYVDNGIAIERLNEFHKYPRELITNSINNGIFTGIPNNSSLIVKNTYWWEFPWDQQAFYNMQSPIHFKYVAGGRNIRWMGSEGYVINPADVINNSDIHYYKFSDTDYVYYLSYISTSSDKGYVISGKLRNYVASNDEVYIASAKSSYIYIYDREINDIDKLLINGIIVNTETNLTKNFSYSINDLEMVSGGNNWKLLQITPPSNTDLDLLSLYIIGI